MHEEVFLMFLPLPDQLSPQEISRWSDQVVVLVSGCRAVLVILAKPGQKDVELSQ